jgi:hypothetical protein
MTKKKVNECLYLETEGVRKLYAGLEFSFFCTKHKYKAWAYNLLLEKIYTHKLFFWEKESPA